MYLEKSIMIFILVFLFGVLESYDLYNFVLFVYDIFIVFCKWGLSFCSLFIDYRMWVYSFFFYLKLMYVGIYGEFSRRDGVDG